MTPAAFRTLALKLPETTESAHHGHPDFRVRGKIFATLGWPRSGWGMIKLTPKQQITFVQAQPDIFSPVKGAWGRRGGTSVLLRAAGKRILQEALAAAWKNMAPTRLRERIDVQ